MDLSARLSTEICSGTALSSGSHIAFTYATLRGGERGGEFLAELGRRRRTWKPVKFQPTLVVAATNDSKHKNEPAFEPNPAKVVFDSVLNATYLNAVSASLKSPSSTRLLSSPEIPYFAFGANLNQRVLRGRRGITPLAQEPAVLKQYRLAFNMLSLSALEPSFASVEPSAAGDEVHGVLYRLTRSQFLSLCRSEAVTVHPYEGTQQTAFTLRTSDGPWRSPWGLDVPPSRRYLGLIREGARESGLREEWLEHLRNLKTSLF
eukprot:jgi/Mesvir1/5028/Mv02236-RA.1